MQAIQMYSQRRSKRSKLSKSLDRHKLITFYFLFVYNNEHIDILFIIGKLCY